MDHRLLQPLKRGKLRVLATRDCMPYCRRRDDGTWEGIEVDIMRSFALHVGCTVDFVVRKPGRDYQAKLCIHDGYVSGFRRSSADVDFSIGGYSDADPNPVVMSACSTFPWHVEDMYVDRQPDDIPTKYMTTTPQPGREDTEDVAQMNWPSVVRSRKIEAQKIYLEDKDSQPANEVTNFGIYTTFTLPKKGNYYKLVAYPNIIYCRTVSFMSGHFSAHVVRMTQSGQIDKLLKKYKLGNRKGSVPASINPNYVRLAKSGVLQVSAPTFLPVMDAARKIGIDVAIFKEFAKILKVELILKPITTESMSYDSENFAVGDVWAGGLSYSLERENSYTQWTAPYMTTKRSCIYRANDKYRSLKDVTGRVYVRASSSAHDDAYRQGLVAKTVNDSDMTESDVFQDLLDGKVTGVLRGSIVAEAMEKSYPGTFAHFEWERDPKRPEHLYYMVSTGSNLNVALSAFVQHMISSGQMKEIVDKSYSTMKTLKLDVKNRGFK